MRELVQAKLVKQILPKEYIDKIPRFEESFLQLIDQNESMRPADLNSVETSRIHIEKFGDTLVDQLCDMGLARSDGYPWFEVEITTADLFMTYLASVLGRLDDIQMCPITDNSIYFSSFPGALGKNINSKSPLDKIRTAVVDEILPVPNRVIPVSELYNFKSRYSQLLSHLRRNIESVIFEISQIQDNEARSDRLDVKKRNLSEEITEIRERMHERKWPQVNLGTVCGLIATWIPTAEAISTGDPSASLKALPGLIGAIYSAFNGTKYQNEIMHSPLAYAALFQERFRIEK